MSGWDRASPGYLAEWQPNFAPYEADLAAELGLREGDKVLTMAGFETLALARSVGESGHVFAWDSSDEVLVLCKEKLAAAGMSSRVTLSQRPSAGPFDAAVSAFDPAADLRSLGETIRADGKVGVMLWGPATDGDPERAFANIIDELHPEMHATEELAGLDRASLASLFERAGLAVVRHTIVMHPLVFQHAEKFARSLLAARTYGLKLVARGETHVGAALARFYQRVAAQDAPISYSPAATIIIAAHPGAEVELPHRPSVRVPT